MRSRANPPGPRAAGISGMAMAALAAALWMAGPGGASTARAARSDYVGTAVCGGCHAAAFQSWKKSAHARADALLGPSPAARCLACHTTGEAPAGPALTGGVGCESCHGPGAAYAVDDVMRDPRLAGLLGLRDLSTPALRAALCAGCHRQSTRLTPFDPDAAYRLIEHQ